MSQDSPMTTVGAAAAGILRRGVQLDRQSRFTEALVCYQEGLQILVDNVKTETDDSVKFYLRSKIEEFMNRGEAIKKLILEQKATGQYHEQIFIENNSTGHSYRTLFGRFLDGDVEYVVVEDPYVRSFHQCQNFLRLTEVVVRDCPNVRRISLLTSPDTKPGCQDQEQWLSAMTEDLKRYNVRLEVKFSETLHDRQIILSTGWIIKIGRGLDFYRPPEHRFSLGMHDLDMRPCHETTVNIFHSSSVKLSYG